MAEDLLKCLFFTVEIILSDESIAHGLNQKLKSTKITTDNLLLGDLLPPYPGNGERRKEKETATLHHWTSLR